MKTGRNARSQHANLEALRQHSGRRLEPQPWITSGPADQARATVWQAVLVLTRRRDK